MANELTVTATLTDNNTGVAKPALAAVNVNQAGTRYTMGRQSVGTSEEALQLGEVAGTVLGWCVVKNLDSTNFVQVLSATAGTAIVKIKAGEMALFRFGSGVTAPYVIADTGACLVEYRIYED